MCSFLLILSIALTLVCHRKRNLTYTTRIRLECNRQKETKEFVGACLSFLLELSPVSHHVISCSIRSQERHWDLDHTCKRDDHCTKVVMMIRRWLRRRWSCLSNFLSCFSSVLVEGSLCLCLCILLWFNNRGKKSRILSFFLYSRLKNRNLVARK